MQAPRVLYYVVINLGTISFYKNLRLIDFLTSRVYNVYGICRLSETMMHNLEYAMVMDSYKYINIILNSYIDSRVIKCCSHDLQ